MKRLGGGLTWAEVPEGSQPAAEIARSTQSPDASGSSSTISPDEPASRAATARA